MRQRILIALLAMGAVGGYAAGFAHLHAHHHGCCAGHHEAAAAETPPPPR